MAKKKVNEKEAKALTYKGMKGKLGKRQKEAVDALELVVKEALKLEEELINFDGLYNRIIIDDELSRPSNLWQLRSITITRYSVDNPLAVYYMTGNPEAGNVLHAALRVLETYGLRDIVKKQANGLDPHGTAKEHLAHVLKLPNASLMRQHLYYVLWAEKKLKGISLVDFLASRPLGFYGDVLKDTLINIADTMAVDFRCILDEQLASAKQIKPLHVFQLVFRGYDKDNPYSHHLLKHVAAMPSVFQQWMKFFKISEYLQQNPVDLVATEHDETKRETIMRDALSKPVGKGGADARIDYSKEADKFHYHTSELEGKPDIDWPEDVVRFEFDERRRADSDYCNSSEYQRVEEEILTYGESNYREQTVSCNKAGYEAGKHNSGTLLELMRMLDKEYLSKLAPIGASIVNNQPKPKKEPKPKKLKAAKVETAQETAQEPAKEVKEDIKEEQPLWPSNGEVSLEEIVHRKEMPWERVQQFFKETAGVDDVHEVAAIERHLLTDYQRDTLKEYNLTVKDIIEGNYNNNVNEFVKSTLDDWNNRLGSTVFYVGD